MRVGFLALAMLALGMLALTVLALATALATGQAVACERYPQPPLPTAEVVVQSAGGDRAITAELATTDEQRGCGLMGRPALAPDRGMLFDMRPPGPAFFWMDNTPEPLDMLFADPTGVIIHIEHDAVPLSRRVRGTRKAVAAVLELAGGSARRLGIRLGDRIVLPWAKAQRP